MFVHRLLRPARQQPQVRQGRLGSRAAFVPGSRSSTPGPGSITTPDISWPRIMGSRTAKSPTAPR